MESTTGVDEVFSTKVGCEKMMGLGYNSETLSAVSRSGLLRVM